MEVSVTDLLSLFLTKIYVLVFFAFNKYFSWRNKGKQNSTGTMPEPLSPFLFHSSLSRLPRQPLHLQCHPPTLSLIPEN